jgi:hypothetical protein
MAQGRTQLLFSSVLHEKSLRVILESPIVVLGGHRRQGPRGLLVADKVCEQAASHSLRTQGLRLFAGRDVHKQVDCTDEIARLIEQWCRIRTEIDAGAIRAFSDSFNPPDGTPFPYRDCHWASIVWKELTLVSVELPGNAPVILADTRRAPGEGNAGSIVVGDHALGACDVDCRRKLVQGLEKALVSTVHGFDGGLQHFVGHRNVGMHAISLIQRDNFALPLVVVNENVVYTDDNLQLHTRM